MDLETIIKICLLCVSFCELFVISVEGVGSKFDCYDHYGNLNTSSDSAEAAAHLVNRVRYFNLFTRRTTPPPRTGNMLYTCWDSQYYKPIAKITSKVGRNKTFASFSSPHQEAVVELDVLIKENIDSADPLHNRVLDFLEYLRHYRNDIHPQLLLHAISLAEVSTRSPLLHYATPSLPEIFPTRFYPNLVKSGSSGNNAKCVLVNDQWGATKTNGIENRLWYFREDVQLNNHHWTWHLKYPTGGTFEIPRRGEFFYFFHHDLIARYASERLANGFRDYFVDGLVPVKNLLLPQGYDSNLQRGVASMDWVNRPNATRLNEKTLSKSLYQQLLSHQTLWQHVDQITRTGTVVNLNNETVILLPDGTNVIGELFEASRWTINEAFYGTSGWHNTAHNLIGNVKLQSNQSDDEYGVLAEQSTAHRDILFYRIHREVDKMFVKYKHRILEPYDFYEGNHPLIQGGVVIQNISILGNKNRQNLTTFWNNKNIFVDGGLDFITDNLKLDVCLKHLDHEEFVYNIDLINLYSVETTVFIRIFMAPRHNLYRTRFPLVEQFPLFFVMDAFPQKLNPGANRIIRKSQDSMLTKDWWTPSESLDPTADGECSCGFPAHLILPKGSENGREYDVVVMVTDGDDFTGKPEDYCYSSFVHCGHPAGIGYDYPDRKPMGYPWDRKPLEEMQYQYLEDFVSEIPNMFSTRVTIVHDDNVPKEHDI